MMKCVTDPMFRFLFGLTVMAFKAPDCVNQHARVLASAFSRWLALCACTLFVFGKLEAVSTCDEASLNI